MRCYATGRMTAAATATLPGMSIYAIAARPLYIYEITVTNTTATECLVAVQRLASAGTQGAAITEFCEDNEVTPVANVVNSHTSTPPTLTAGEAGRVTLGATKGSGYVFTWGGRGLRVPAGTANGLGLLCPTGTGQICDVSFVWEE